VPGCSGVTEATRGGRKELGPGGKEEDGKHCWGSYKPQGRELDAKKKKQVGKEISKGSRHSQEEESLAAAKLQKREGGELRKSVEEENSQHKKQ